MMGDNMPWFRFALQVLPPTLLGVALTLMGASSLAGRLTGTPLLVVLIAACIGYAGSLAFRDARGWNLAFFVAFTSLAGAALGNLFPSPGGLPWIMAFVYASAVIGLSAGLSPWLGRWMQAMAFSLQALFWIYLAGWVLIALLNLPRISMLLWAGAGLMIFLGLGAGWFHGLPRRGQRPQEGVFPRVFGLYVLGFNLAIAIKVLSLGVD